MTALAAWIGIDSRAPSSAYIATDSRISWVSPGGRTPVGSWDRGRKVFASASYPDIFGFVGDVLFPSLVLGQFITALDLGLLVGEGAPLRERQSALERLVRRSIAAAPLIARDPFVILHVGRANVGLASVFETRLLKWDGVKLTTRRPPPPHHSAVLRVGSVTTRGSVQPVLDGSGASEIKIQLAKWRASKHADTSRSVFSAFCDALRTGNVLTVGGPPQLVGLRRIGTGCTLGVVFDGETSVLGIPTPNGPPGSIEYRNEVFERVDSGGMILPGAQRHSRP